LKIIEFFAALIACNYSCIDQEIIRLNVLSSCLELFLKYPWNNFLHTTIESIVNTILDGENEDLKIYLLKEAGLLDTIVKASKSNEEECAKPKGVRRGFMGHITTMSTSLINLASVSPTVEKILAEHEEWNSYVRGALSATKERESRTLGGYIASGDFNGDEGEDIDEYEENGEVGFDSNNLENREDYSAEEGSWRMNQDDEEDFEEEEGVVIHSRIEQDDEQEGESEVWEERDIKDVEDETQQTSDVTNQLQENSLEEERAAATAANNNDSSPSDVVPEKQPQAEEQPQQQQQPQQEQQEQQPEEQQHQQKQAEQPPQQQEQQQEQQQQEQEQQQKQEAGSGNEESATTTNHVGETTES
jgi:serine/threonine-protein phosphatase 6 regulatory subunit 3